MYKVLISDKLGQAGLDILDAAADVEYVMTPGMSKEAIIAAVPAYDAWIVRSGTRPDADMIAAGTKLKCIGRAGAGVDNIDLDAATKAGVVVMNTPGANAMATAEQTMAMMLAVSRHTAHAHKSLLDGAWERKQYMGSELYVKTLGIIGLGKIGALVAQRALAFGMEIVAYDPYVSEDKAKQLGVTLVNLDDLYAQSDYITLHTAVTADTKNMLNADAFAQMKDGAIIVNVARGALIDEAALLAALESGKVGAAALDVFQTEPPTDNRLIGHPRVTHTPHLGASSLEAQANVGKMVADQVVDCLRGDDVRNAVNLPFDAGPSFAAIQPYMALARKLGQLQWHIATDKITRVEIEVRGTQIATMVRPIAAAILQGIVEERVAANGEGPAVEINYINSPMLADQMGIHTRQTRGLCEAEYPNLIACKVYWGAGEAPDEMHMIAGMVVAGKYPRIVQWNRYLLEATPEGVMLLMRNRDEPGVVGRIGTLLAAEGVNIAEWRMGRTAPGGEALCVLNLDMMPKPETVAKIWAVPAVVKVKVVEL